MLFNPKSVISLLSQQIEKLSSEFIEALDKQWFLQTKSTSGLFEIMCCHLWLLPIWRIERTIRKKLFLLGCPWQSSLKMVFVATARSSSRHYYIAYMYI